MEAPTRHSTCLQELSVASLGGDGRTMEPPCQLAIEANFGSVERWRNAFVAGAKASGGGPGWMLLVFRTREGTLVNQWATDSTDVMAGGVPLLALEMQPQAMPVDRGVAADVEAVMDSIDWARVYMRYQQAVHDASEPFGAAQGEVGDALVLDVRRAGVFEKATAMLPGARWCDPVAVAEWSGGLAVGRGIVVYCIYGHEVGRSTAMRLRAAGLDARYLRGGIDAWQAAGRPVVAPPGRGVAA